MVIKSKKFISRREFLILSVAAAGGIAINAFRDQLNTVSAAPGSGDPRVYLPYIVRPGTAALPTATPVPPTATPVPPTAVPTPVPTQGATIPPPPNSGRVVHVRKANATSWNGSGSTSYFNFVNQAYVDAMAQEGLAQLTGQSTWTGIWASLFGRVSAGGYQPGQKIAIKVNFNTSGLDEAYNNCTQHDNRIDALPHPVLALIKGMVAAGVQPGDIYCYDATGKVGYPVVGRIIPDYFRSPITAAFPGVHYVGCPTCGVSQASHGKHSSLTVNFTGAGAGLTARTLADILYDATYLINMPILKQHGGDGAIPITLGFKNHCGSINYVYDSGSNNLHSFFDVTQGIYNQNYNPLVEIYQNSNIKNKTILTVGDGLFGSIAYHNTAASWQVFGNQAANSLFFSIDPVAIDCVMADILKAERLLSGTGGFTTPRAYDYLFCAQTAGLGVCEGTRNSPGGKPFQTPYGSGYATLQYIRRDI
jgi:hypothetical protein